MRRLKTAKPKVDWDRTFVLQSLDVSFCTYSQIGLLVENREIYIGLPQRYSTPCRNFALMFSAAKNRMIGLPHSGLPHDNGTGPLIILFLVLHFNFLFVPCGRLSWLPVSFLLHVKYTLSYRKVWWYVPLFRYNIATWQSDRQTDGQRDGQTISRVSSTTAVALLCWRAIKTIRILLLIYSRELYVQNAHSFRKAK